MAQVMVQSNGKKRWQIPFLAFEVTDTKDGGRVLDASAHLLSRALVSQSASESWCLKYSVTSSVKKTPFYIYLSLRHPPSFVLVTSSGKLCFVEVIINRLPKASLITGTIQKENTMNVYLQLQCTIIMFPCK
jgi:hypothetical protein